MALTNMVFPKYEYREYPKWVTIEGNEPVLVENQRDEEELFKKSQVEISEEEIIDQVALDELPEGREELVQLAKSLGITVKRVWGVNKLKAEILKLKEDE